MVPAGPHGMALGSSWLRCLLLGVGLVSVVVGCGVDDYLQTSQKTWARIKQFDEDEKRLAGAALIPSMERTTDRGVIKGPLLELFFRPPAGFTTAPATLPPPPGTNLTVLQYLPATAIQGPISSLWLVIAKGRNLAVTKTELPKVRNFNLPEGIWEKKELTSASLRGTVAVEWLKPPSKPTTAPSPQPVPAAPKTGGGKAKAPTPPPPPPSATALAFLIGYASPVEPATLALVYQPVPGQEAAAQELAMRSAATLRTLAAAASESVRLKRRGPAAKGGAPPGAPGTPVAPGGTP